MMYAVMRPPNRRISVARKAHMPSFAVAKTLSGLSPCCKCSSDIFYSNFFAVTIRPVIDDRDLLEIFRLGREESATPESRLARIGGSRFPA
jgi:hypothetical protein